MINRRQINQLVFERNRRVSITMSAMKAGVSRNTARKYLRQTDPSKQEKQPHDWRTRKDPLEAVWSVARGMLETAPELEAKALFEHLGERTEGGLEEKVFWDGFPRSCCSIIPRQRRTGFLARGRSGGSTRSFFRSASISA
jgi:hypothetical protein